MQISYTLKLALLHKFSKFCNWKDEVALWPSSIGLISYSEQIVLGIENTTQRPIKDNTSTY